MNTAVRSLLLGLVAVVLVALVLVPPRAVFTVLGPVAVTAALGTAVFVLVARRRPPDEQQPGSPRYDPPPWVRRPDAPAPDAPGPEDPIAHDAPPTDAPPTHEDDR